MFLGSQQELDDSAQILCQLPRRPSNVIHTSSPWPRQLDLESSSVKSPHFIPETSGTILQKKMKSFWVTNYSSKWGLIKLPL